MLLVPLAALMNFNFLRIFPLLFIGANPYVASASLLASFFFRFGLVVKFDTRKSIYIVFFIWLFYSILLMIKGFDTKTFSELFQLILAITLFNSIYNYINSEERLNRIMDGLMYSGIFLALIESIIFFGNLNIVNSSFIGSDVENYTAFYVLVTCSAIPLYRLKNNYTKFVVLAIAFFAITLNQSRAALLIFYILIAAYFYLNTRNKLLVTFVAFLGLASFSVYQLNSIDLYDNKSIYSLLNLDNNFSNLERIALIQYAYEVFQSSPEGHGIGSATEITALNPYTVLEYPHPHNTLALFMIEQGILGVLIYISIFASCFRQISLAPKKIKDLMYLLLLVVLLLSLADAIFYNGSLTLLFFMVLGLITASSKLEDHA